MTMDWLEHPKKRALITGVTGQDGSYLAELLLSKNYEVYGLERRIALQDQDLRHSRIKGLDIELLPGDITHYGSVDNAVEKARPDEVYHLAAQSFVKLSFDDEFQTLDTNVIGTANILHAVKRINPKAKFYFAGSSEQYGNPEEIPSNERTRFHPRSPYAVSKLAGFCLTRNYREAYNMFACSGILFNHESPRRGKEFVTRKITKGVWDIVNRKSDKLLLGNIDAKRDWGFAGDYVKAMHLMLQQDKPDDYVIATGETNTIRDFLDEAFDYVGIKDWSKYIGINKAFMRPSDVEILQGDASKAKRELGWESKVKFKDLVKMMMEADK